MSEPMRPDWESGGMGRAGAGPNAPGPNMPGNMSWPGAAVLKSRFARSDWIAVGTGALAFVVSFLPWYSVSYTSGSFGVSRSFSASAWDSGFAAWFPMLMLLLLAGLVVLRHVGLRLSAQAAGAVRIVLMAVPAVAAVLVLLRWLTFPGGSDEFGSAGAGFGLFVGLLTALGGCVGSWLVFRRGSIR